MYAGDEFYGDDITSGPYDGLLWDADPEVCCAARQLGACPHTEDAIYEQQVAADTDAAYVAADYNEEDVAHADAN